MSTFSNSKKIRSVSLLSILITFGACLGKSDLGAKKNEKAIAEPATKRAKLKKLPGAVVQIKKQNKVEKTFKFEQIKGAYTCPNVQDDSKTRRKRQCGTLHLIDIDLKKKTLKAYHIWNGEKTDLTVNYTIEAGNIIGSLWDGDFSIDFGDENPAMELVHVQAIKGQASKEFTKGKDKDDLQREVFVYDPKRMFKTKGRKLFGEMPGQVEVRSDAILPNASVKKLQIEDVENLMHVDLEVLRNAIYARHGQSFKDNRILGFFYGQKGYLPTFTGEEVELKLSTLEKENIKLIHRYESNAERFYKALSR